MFMNKRELIKRIINGENTERTGFWLGNPHPETWPALHAYFDTSTEEELRQKLNDDVRWICPQFYDDVYQDPMGREMFDAGLDREKHARPPLADCSTLTEVEDFTWPNPDYLHFDTCIRDLNNAGDVYRLSGFWCCFFHNVADLFGMENYFLKMLIEPDIVRAVTRKVCEFYLEANKRFFEKAGNLVDGFFFGNDFGTQKTLIVGLEQFNEFIMPWFKNFTAQGLQYNYQVVLHSCGAIYDVIDQIINAGVSCIHPIQAKAERMDARTLADSFKGRVTFMGGIDTQDLMTNGKPDEIRAEVRRVKSILGPGLIVSTSHEAILPNVPPENVEALAKAAFEE
jgi:uroporphyrinogen decarboxylase